ncbi:MAG TPA: TMEM175 family protein [Candidatus Eremiobacteraceae bacterium]|nr:TMEM175 family protein [Candidatus Eremiobacteraceae bacterium]
MGKGRLEAFSDGVIAIIITIMVLDLKAPRGADLSALRPVIPVFLNYVLSFVYVGIYWNNHHHMIHTAARVNGRILWANLHLLFWLSLIPFATNWIGESHLAPTSVAFYGFIMLMAGISYSILSAAIIALHGSSSTLAIAVGKNYKGTASVVIYAIAVPLALVHPRLSLALYVLVAMMWFLPDPRIEKVIAN